MFLAGAITFFAAPGRAQICHQATVPTPGALGIEARFSGIRLTEAQGGGQALGLLPSGTIAWGRFDAEARIPTWTLVRGADLTAGLGDMGLRAGVSLAGTSATGTPQFGVDLAATLPSGDHAQGFGMGHVMVAPGIFARGLAGRLGWGARVAWGRALGSAAQHHHHGGAAGQPIENMNASELTAAAATAAHVSARVALTLTAAWAEPVGDPSGQRRATAALGAEFSLAAAVIGGEIEAPVIGGSHAGKVGLYLRVSR